jgi:hypothetical protein
MSYPTGTSGDWLVLVLLPCKSATQESWGAAHHCAAFSFLDEAASAKFTRRFDGLPKLECVMTNSDKMFKQAVFRGFSAPRIGRENELRTVDPLPKKRVTLWARYTRLSCNRSLRRLSGSTPVNL